MKVRAILHLKNEAMLVARERLGLSQIATAELCGVSINAYRRYERLDFSFRKDPMRQLQDIHNMAALLEVPVEDIWPEEYRGQIIDSKRTVVADIDMDRLLEAKAHETPRLLLDSPLELAEIEDSRGLILRVVNSAGLLTDNQRKALCMRYGLDGYDPMTLGEVGTQLKLTRERVSQIVLKAERILHSKMDGHIYSQFFPTDPEPAEEPVTFKTIKSTIVSSGRKKARPLKPLVD